MNAWKQKNPNIKISMSVGGWNEGVIPKIIMFNVIKKKIILNSLKKNSLAILIQSFLQMPLEPNFVNRL
jgi:GH18 family chitinase